MPYCRSNPLLQYVEENSTIEFKASKKGIAYQWHIDHGPIFAQMIYLSDVKQDGTCMEIVSGSHRYPNVVQRARPVHGTDRLWLFSDFSWGENILFDMSAATGMLATAMEPLSALTAVQREAMPGIFSQTPFKGCCMKNGYLSTQIFREI